APPSSAASTPQPAPAPQTLAPQKQNEADATKTADLNGSLAAQSESRHSASEDKPVLQDNFRAVLKQRAAGAPTKKAKTDADSGQVADKSTSILDGRQSDLNALSADGIEERKDRGEFAKQAASSPALAQSPPKARVGEAAGGIIGGREREKSTRDEA